MSLGHPTRKLSSFPLGALSVLVSWVKTEQDLALWSGNTFRNGFSRLTMERHLKRSDLDSFAYLDEKKNLLCYADIVRKDSRTAVLCRVIVHPNHRRKGLGKEFCKDLLQWAKNNGNYLEVHLNTLGRNKPALACYESLGFTTLLIKPNCRKVCGQWQDLVIMALHLKYFSR